MCEERKRKMDIHIQLADMKNLGYKCVGELTDFYKNGINCYLMMKRRG